jgi:hypothetical protein
MERTMRPAFKYVCTSGIELRVEFAESVVDWSGTEYSYSLALSFLYLKPLGLNDYAEALNKEDTTEDGEQYLLVDDNGAYSDDSANGK